IALARWSRTFSALYSAGVPIMQAIEVTGQTAGNALIEEAMDSVIESVKAGGSIAAPLREATIFPSMVAQMIAVGEETGNLDTMLTKIADFYEDEVAAAIKALTSILEPLMIIIVGAMVGFIVISMYMPLFKVYDAIKKPDRAPSQTEPHVSRPDPDAWPGARCRAGGRCCARRGAPQRPGGRHLAPGPLGRDRH